MNRAWARRRASQRVRMMLRRGYRTRASRLHVMKVWESISGGPPTRGV